MARIVDVVVETGTDGFSCFVSREADDLQTTFVGYGKTARDAVEDFMAAYHEAGELAREDGSEFPELEFRFLFDVGSCFNFYPLSITAFARYIGMNPSLLRQYASGVKSPSAKTLERIRQGFHAVGNDICHGLLVERPAGSYA